MSSGPIVSDLLMLSDHLRRFSSRSVSISADSAAGCCRRCGRYRRTELVFNGTINPGKVFDLALPLDRVAEGYRAMDERRAIKTHLCP